MKIVVFGASGKVGRKVVSLLLAEGHQVRAAIHGNDPFQSSPNLEIVKVDIHNAPEVEAAIQGCSAVISTLGSWGTKTKDILSAGMKNIVPAMTKYNINRIVCITGAGAMDATDSPNVIDKLSRPLLMLVAPRILKDGEEHMAILRASSLDWTVVRSPVMKKSGSRGFALSARSPLPWATINRKDVATAMVRLVVSNEWARSAPFISRK
jgi:putative NADH-flavin reductase